MESKGFGIILKILEARLTSLNRNVVFKARLQYDRWGRCRRGVDIDGDSKDIRGDRKMTRRKREWTQSLMAVQADGLVQEVLFASLPQHYWCFIFFSLDLELNI